MLPTLGPDDLASAKALAASAMAGEPFSSVAVTRHRRDGAVIDLALSGAPILDASGAAIALSVMAADVTDQVKLATQQASSQRLESVGRLAGGVAHDFNNLLTAILGSAEFLRDTLPEDGPGREEVDEIEKAALRGADLTRQLLSVSRKRILTPEVVDANALITDLKRMLDRVLGEDIRFDVHLRPGIGQGPGRSGTPGPGDHEPRGERARCDADRRPADDLDRRRDAGRGLRGDPR